jgi:hypothetical protein
MVTVLQTTADNPDDPAAGLHRCFIFIMYGLDVRLRVTMMMMMLSV